MTIQELGSLGELVAAIATVATLAYLAIQIRANSNLMRAESHRSVTEKASQVNLSLARDHQLADVFRRGLMSYESLEPAEQIQFTFLLSEWISALDLAVTEHRAGIVDQRAIDKVLAGVRGIFLSPGGQAFLRIYRRNFVMSPELLELLGSEVPTGRQSSGTATVEAAAQQGDEVGR